jgi:ferredoxin-nitrite reductase
MNKFEQIKAAKDGLDALEDIERYARLGWEAITDDDKVRMKWYGLFFRKHTPGYFMLRIRIPNGIATSNQLRTIADIANDFGRGELDLTTRQQIQVRWFRIEHVPEMFRRLAAAGLEVRQTGMDNIRNVMGCPLTGVTTHELFDAAPMVREYTARFVGSKAFSNLPRKFNVTIAACTDNCVPLETQDIALGPAVRHIDGVPVAGFNVLIGGKQGSGGYTPTQALDVFTRPEEAAEICATITEIFRDHGPRESRSRARMAFLVQDWGIGRIREEVERRLGRELEPAGRDARSAHHADHLGVSPQRERGVYSVGLAVPVGRLQAAHARAIADLADEYGRGEARLTPSQNVILTHVPDTRLTALLAEPLLSELRVDPAPAMRGTVSCIGIGLCDLAMTDTKGDAFRVARRLEATVPTGRSIAINWSGCPAACGSHHVADIGLQGGKARVGGQVAEVYQVFVGGKLGPGARGALPVLSAVPATQIDGVIERLVKAHAAGQDLVAVGREIAGERGEAGASQEREEGVA